MAGSALIVNDIQKDISHAFGDTDMFRQMVATAVALVAWARSSGIPVIYTRLGYRTDYADASRLHGPMVKQFNILQDGTTGAEFIDALAPQAGDFVITRQRVSQFYQTRLELVMRTLAVDTAIITGCSTDHSVSSFARDASDRDLRVIVVSDGCSASKPQFQQPALDMIADFFGEVMTGEQVMKSLSA